MKVGLFIPCYIDAFSPEVGVATLQLLERLGCHDYHRHGAEYIVSADMSCLMHMKGVRDRLKLPMKVIHIGRILNGGPL